jgi:hypothetical protein
MPRHNRTRFTWNSRLVRSGDGWTVEPSAAELVPLVLARSEGYVVESAAGTVGVVEGIEEDEQQEVTALLVAGHAGWFRIRWYRVSVDAVTALDPGREVVHINLSAAEQL